MISYLQGKIILKKEKFIILDVNGVGYKVFLSQKALSKLPGIGENLNVFCFLDVGENKMNLYGFLDGKELDFFEILNNISGIGPKVALEISALGPLEKIKDRILAQDDKLFEGIPGVGRKRAMAIILELSGKIKDVSVVRSKKELKIDEAEDTLVGLGFPRQKAKDALSKVPRNVTETENRIKEAPKLLGR
jgi:Holliday junction DNA helicase RuvA